MDNTQNTLKNLDYGQRGEIGRGVEQQMLNLLRGKGFKIDPATSGQDKHDKIDAWWIDKSGNRHGTQVKFRQRGDDILIELVANIEANIEGRDMKSKAVLYLIADRQGITRLYSMKPIKDKANQILHQVESDLDKNPNQTLWSGPGWEARVQVEPNPRIGKPHRKIVSYLKQNLFEPYGTWNLNLHESILREVIRREIKCVLKEVLN